MLRRKPRFGFVIFIITLFIGAGLIATSIMLDNYYKYHVADKNGDGLSNWEDVDVNGDGIVDYKDALMVASMEGPTTASNWMCDINGDGVVDKYDIDLVLYFATEELQPKIENATEGEEDKLVLADKNGDGIIDWRDADVNMDGVLNIRDVAIIASAYNKSVGEEGYAPQADLNEDGVIDDYDIEIFWMMWDYYYQEGWKMSIINIFSVQGKLFITGVVLTTFSIIGLISLRITGTKITGMKR